MKREASVDSEDDATQQCCLKAFHIFLSSCLLLMASVGVLIASYLWEQEDLLPFRKPCVAVVCLSVVIAIASGSLAAFVELRLQDRWRICRVLYFLQCYICMDEEDSQQLKEEILTAIICLESPEERPLPSKQPLGYGVKYTSDTQQAPLALNE